MKLEAQTNDILVAGERQIAAVDTIKAVKPVDAQALPQDGKELPTDLPVEKEKAVEPSENIEKAAKAMNLQAQLVQRDLQFRVDKESERVVITVTDSATNEVIRQIPEEEALQYARRLSAGSDLEILDTFA